MELGIQLKGLTAVFDRVVNRNKASESRSIRPPIGNVKLASYIPVCIILIPFLLALTKVYVYIGEANAYLGVVAMAAVVLNAMPAHPAIVRQLDKRFLGLPA